MVLTFCLGVEVALASDLSVARDATTLGYKLRGIFSHSNKQLYSIHAESDNSTRWHSNNSNLNNIKVEHFDQANLTLYISLGESLYFLKLQKSDNVPLTIMRSNEQKAPQAHHEHQTSQKTSSITLAKTKIQQFGIHESRQRRDRRGSNIQSSNSSKNQIETNVTPRSHTRSSPTVNSKTLNRVMRKINFERPHGEKTP